MKVTLYTSKTFVKQLLVYLRHIVSNKDESINNYCVYSLIDLELVSDIDWENVENVNMLALGDGCYDIYIDDKKLRVEVSSKVHENTKLFHTYGTMIPDIIKMVTIDGEYDDDYFYGLIKKAVKYCENFAKKYNSKKEVSIKKYIFDVNDYCWELMNTTTHKHIDTLFLKAGEKEKLFEYINDFFSKDSEIEYSKFNMPYKCNILLWGVPGTGKTSTILAVASHLKMNIGLIPMSSVLDDTKLIYAINSIKKKNCNIIVLEDIDSMFGDKKIADNNLNTLTLSGVLNCLDGLYRNKGVMIFMTANNIDNLENALLRSGRIDYKLYFDYANEDQARQCFKHCFPDKMDQIDSVINHLKGKKYTLAMLQSFFFKNKKRRFSDCMNDFDNVIDNEIKNTKTSMYT